MLEWLSQAVVTGLLALVGALAGARFALGRFKEERGFDLRLDWHVWALGVIYELSRRTRAFPIMRGKEHEAAEEAFQQVIGEAPAFMTLQRYRSMRLAEAEHWNADRQTASLLDDMENESEEGKKKLLAEALESMEQERRALEDAKQLVVEVIREMVRSDAEPSRWQRWQWRTARKQKALRNRKGSS